jgi:Cu2+-exporting ATPase
LRESKYISIDFERRLKNCTFIDHFQINLACNSVVINYRGNYDKLISMLIEPLPIKQNNSRDTLQVEVLSSNVWAQKPIHSLFLSASALVLSMSSGPLLSMSLVLLSAVPIWRRALSTLFIEKRLNVDFLDGLALAIAVVRLQTNTAALLELLVHLGDVVRERTARQSRGHIHDLLDFHSVQARLLEMDGIITMVAADSLIQDQLVMVLAGDLVPADGQVISGIASVDQRHITGESIPSTVQSGDSLFAGSSIVEGSVSIRITHAGKDTVASKIVQLVESAPSGDTRIQNYAEKFADHLVAPMLGVNLALLLASGNLDRFMSLAIVDYGTGIRVAAPTSILTSMTRAAREGILIKSGRIIEQLGTLKGIAFDKTGTLTTGKLDVVEVKAFDVNISIDRILQLAAAAEMELRHPVAKALVAYAQNIKGLQLPQCSNIEFVIGLGVSAEINGHKINIGSERYFKRLNITIGKAQSYLGQLENLGHIGLLVAYDERLIGAICCSDEPRAESRRVLEGLRRRGVREIVMLSGDREGVAKRIAHSVGIDKVYAEVLPHEKADIIRELKRSGGPFAMVGDGVNDSPALAQADIGISLVDGADIARTAADVVLMREGLHLLLPAIDISRDALQLVKQNYSLIAGFNTLALALALPSGLITPATCTLISNGSTLLATMNAMRPLLPRLRRLTESD